MCSSPRIFCFASPYVRFNFVPRRPPAVNKRSASSTVCGMNATAELAGRWTTAADATTATTTSNGQTSSLLIDDSSSSNNPFYAQHLGLSLFDDTISGLAGSAAATTNEGASTGQLQQLINFAVSVERRKCCFVRVTMSPINPIIGRNWGEEKGVLINYYQIKLICSSHNTS